MITCEIFRRHVDAVVDGEVDPDTQIEFEQHLASCGPCRVHLSFVQGFKGRVKEACADAPAAPPDLAARLRKALDAEDARKAAALPDAPVGARADAPAPLGLQGFRVMPIKARYAVPAAAAAVALAVFAAREGGNPDAALEGLHAEAGVATPPSMGIFEDVVQRHSSEHPAEVSGPPTQVAGWFRDKLHFQVQPMEFTGPDVRLVGARISNVRDREAAAFYYTVRGRRVTVMVFEPPAPVDRIARRVDVSGRVYVGRARGYTVPVVQHRGLTYAIAGDLDERSLLQLAASARVRDR